MSWSAPNCPHCHASPTRFEAAVAYGPSFAFALGWVCPICRGRTLELASIGPDETLAPEGCLNCGASRANPSGQVDDRCSACGAEHQLLVDRVRERCGLPPCTQKIRALRDLGLHRVAFNAVLLQLQAKLDDVEALHTKAKLLIDVHRPEQAVPLLRRVLPLGAPADAQIDLGVALAESGQHHAAVLIYLSFMLEHPTHPGRGVVLSNLGGCSSALGRPREAEDYHRQAILADPEHLGPRWNLFANLNKQGRHTEALRAIEQTIELPSLEPAQRENMQAFRAELLIMLGRLHDALAAIDASLISDPDEPERLFTRGKILHELGRLEQARVVLLRLLELIPDSEATQQLLTTINAARGTWPN